MRTSTQRGAYASGAGLLAEFGDRTLDRASPYAVRIAVAAAAVGEHRKRAEEGRKDKACEVDAG